MRRFRAGDRDAFTGIYRAHSPAIHRFSLHMTGDPDRATEVTQDVFVWLIHHPEKFDPQRGELGAFLTGVARKLMQRHWTQAKRWVPYEEADAPAVGPVTGDEDADQLRTAIAALPERYREVVVLCDLEEQSYEEAASRLECATGTVRSRLHRARALLARKLLGAVREVKISLRYSA